MAEIETTAPDALIAQYFNRPLALAAPAPIQLGAPLEIADIVAIGHHGFFVCSSANGKPFRNLLKIA